MKLYGRTRAITAVSPVPSSLAQRGDTETRLVWSARSARHRASNGYAPAAENGHRCRQRRFATGVPKLGRMVETSQNRTISILKSFLIVPVATTDLKSENFSILFESKISRLYRRKLRYLASTKFSSMIFELEMTAQSHLGIGCIEHNQNWDDLMSAMAKNAWACSVPSYRFICCP